MSGKGDNPRPFSVPEHVFSNNWVGALGAKPFEIIKRCGDYTTWCNGIEHEWTKGKPEHPLDRTICDCEIEKES